MSTEKEPQSLSPQSAEGVEEKKAGQDKFIMWDAINGDFYEHETLDDVLKDLKENYCDPEEGIHPEIETIQIFKEVADVVVEQVEGKDTHRVKVVPRLTEYSSILLKEKDEKIKELKGQLKNCSSFADKRMEDILHIAGQRQELIDEVDQLQQLLSEKEKEIEYYKQLAEAAEQLIISVEQYGEYNTKDFEKWQSLKNQKP